MIQVLATLQSALVGFGFVGAFGLGVPTLLGLVTKAAMKKEKR